MVDNKLKAFQILAWKQEQLIAKVLYDNGIKTEEDYVDWLIETNPCFPKAVTNNVRNVIRDFEINFINPNDVPNIFNITNENDEPNKDDRFVGVLNKQFGYNGIEPIEIGTKVFENDSCYYFYMIPSGENKTPVKQKFYKETLSKCITYNN
jgi:hypothetical protein